ncbi:MAG: AraC family transcriptional regulator [Myxococcales bacterium]|nr:AraC family transcriptional regulator [Myxococcales bacterium]
MPVVDGYAAQMQRGIDFIEEHLDEDIELAEVARRAGISRWHFQRIFKALTHETLKTYIRGRRLAHALRKLLETDERIIEIALAAGYDSQESFTRAFKQSFGITPHRYRRLGDKALFLRKVRLDADFLAHLQAGVSPEPTLEERGELRVVGLATTFFGVDSERNNIAAEIPPLWAAFLPRLEEIPHRVPGTCYGVIRQSEASSERLEYIAAMQVTAVGELPEGMIASTLPASRYARFEHRGPVADLDHTVSYAYSTWLLCSGMRHTYGPDLEIYGADYHPVSPDSLIHYAMPVTAR